jgi:hypothetical protein
MSDVEKTAEEWYSNPIQNIQIERIGDFSQTADGACRVKFDGDRIGFVKPRPDIGRSPVVVNEKIASDFGYLLELPVAAVVVREPDETWSNRSAMSLAALTGARHWDVSDANRTPQLDMQMEALRVFWIWIGCTDHHNGNPGNLLYDVANGEFQILAIDHSYAFGHGNIDAATAMPSVGYGLAQTDVSGVQSTIVDKIEHLDIADVNKVVSRLVSDIFTVQDAERVAEWLDVRRKNLRRLLSI